jgi:Spy/CpxP family protein refolding chaperone
MDMKRSNLAIALYLGIVFLSGAVVGGLAMHLYDAGGVRATSGKSRSEAWRAQYLGEMQERLNLTPDQRARLESTLDSTRRLFRELNEKHRPEYDAIQLAQTDQIRAILTPEQREEYEKLRIEREERRKKRGPH